MPSRTQLFLQLPWIGGVNTSIDEAMIPPNQLTVADNVVFDTRGSRKKREGISYNWDDGTTSTNSIIGLHDFWFGATTKTQQIVAVESTGAIYAYVNGTRTTLTDAGTAWSGTLTSCSMLTFNNKVFIAVSGSGNVMKMWDGSGSVVDVPGTPPQASILREHLGRIFCNDKTMPDRIHYCETGNHTMWQGYGDSGGFDIGIGDGDPQGITGIFPTFKGDTFVGKQTKLYRLSGYSPDTINISLVSDGIGVESHNSICAIDQDDVAWISAKGVHSLVASNNYGDFSSTYVSTDIQKTFNESFDRGRLQFSQAAYLPSINSVAFAVTEQSSNNRNITNTLSNNALWIYNINIKAWYRWYDIPCQALVVANDTDKRRFYLGTHTGRVAKTFNGSLYDVSTAGVHTAVRFRVVTGQIFPDTNPYTFKGFKRFILYYKPSGTHNIAVNIRIDNFALDPNNSLAFTATGSSALLGSTFVLGQSALGYDVVLGPYASSIDGIGRGCKIEITELGINEDVEIQGFGLEYELNGTGQEVILK